MPELADYIDPSLSAEQRCELLLARMTLEEKVGQMCQYVGEAAASDTGNVDEKVGYALALGDKVELVRAGRVGSFLKVPGALEANYLQELAAASGCKSHCSSARTRSTATAWTWRPPPSSHPRSASRPASIPIWPSASPRAPREKCAPPAFTGRSLPTSTSLAIRAGAAPGRRLAKTPGSWVSSGWPWCRGYQGEDSTGAARGARVRQAPGGGGVPENGLNGASASYPSARCTRCFIPRSSKRWRPGRVYAHAQPQRGERYSVPRRRETCWAAGCAATGVFKAS